MRCHSTLARFFMATLACLVNSSHASAFSCDVAIGTECRAIHESGFESAGAFASSTPSNDTKPIFGMFSEGEGSTLEGTVDAGGLPARISGYSQVSDSGPSYSQVDEYGRLVHYRIETGAGVDLQYNSATSVYLGFLAEDRSAPVVIDFDPSAQIATYCPNCVLTARTETQKKSKKGQPPTSKPGTFALVKPPHTSQLRCSGNVASASSLNNAVYSGTMTEIRAPGAGNIPATTFRYPLSFSRISLAPPDLTQPAETAIKFPELRGIPRNLIPEFSLRVLELAERVCPFFDSPRTRGLTAEAPSLVHLNLTATGFASISAALNSAPQLNSTNEKALAPVLVILGRLVGSVASFCRAYNTRTGAVLAGLLELALEAAATDGTGYVSGYYEFTAHTDVGKVSVKRNLNAPTLFENTVSCGEVLLAGDLVWNITDTPQLFQARATLEDATMPAATLLNYRRLIGSCTTLSSGLTYCASNNSLTAYNGTFDIGPWTQQPVDIVTITDSPPPGVFIGFLSIELDLITPGGKRLRRGPVVYDARPSGYIPF